MKLVGLAILAAAVLVFAPGAGASTLPSVTCNGTLPAGAYFHVLVGGNTSCVAERGVVITGGLEVYGDFVLGREGGTGLSGVINGGVNMPNVVGGRSIQIHHARITGKVDVSLGVGPTSITNNEIQGSIRADQFGGPTLRIANNTVTGAVRVSRTGWNPAFHVTSLEISGNTIMGDLICGLGGAVNTPLPTLGTGPPNVVFGSKLGECADL